MSSTYTPNKHIEQPANGDYSGDWNVPVNADWTIIDTAFGGTSSISVTGQSGTVILTATQLQAMTLNFTGVLGSNLVYQIPSSIGGQWNVNNATTGAFTLTISYAGGGGSVAIPQGYIVQIYNDTVTSGVSETTTGFTSIGATTQVVYNSSGILTASAGLTYSGTALVVGNTAGSVTWSTTNATGITSNGTVVSTGNMTSGGTLVAAGNITSTAGAITASAGYLISTTGVQTSQVTNPSGSLSLIAEGGNAINLNLGSVGIAEVNGFGILPQADNSYSLGGPSNRWFAVFAVNGTIQTSDERNKDILGDSLGLEFIDKIKPVSYAYKDDEPGTVRQGVIAQQVMEVLADKPFAGIQQKDGYYGMNYSEFIAPLIKSVQELKDENDDLRARVAILEHQSARYYGANATSRSPL